jgi:hypothetical protein
LAAQSKVWTVPSKLKIGVRVQPQSRLVVGVAPKEKGIIIVDKGLEFIEIPSGRTRWKASHLVGGSLSSDGRLVASLEFTREGMRLGIVSATDGHEVRSVRSEKLRAITSIYRISISNDAAAVLLKHSEGIALIRDEDVQPDFSDGFTEGKGRILDAVLTPNGNAIIAVREKGIDIVPLQQ